MMLRRFAIVFLIAQAAGGAGWWCLMLGWPACRVWFRARGAPDATLLAFFVPDVLLFLGSAGAAAYSFWGRSNWAWPLLCVHAGAAGYAALYCWSLTMLTGGNGLLGAVLMTPSLIVPGALVWGLRPKGGKPC